MIHLIPSDKNRFHKQLLLILNFNWNLTDFEVDIMSTILSNNIKTIDTQSRKILVSKLKKSSFTLNNYIKRLKDKGLLIEEGELKVNPEFEALFQDNEITFKFEFKPILENVHN